MHKQQRSRHATFSQLAAAFMSDTTTSQSAQSGNQQRCSTSIHAQSHHKCLASVPGNRSRTLSALTPPGSSVLKIWDSSSVFLPLLEVSDNFLMIGHLWTCSRSRGWHCYNQAWLEEFWIDPTEERCPHLPHHRYRCDIQATRHQ